MPVPAYNCIFFRNCAGIETCIEVLEGRVPLDVSASKRPTLPNAMEDSTGAKDSMYGRCAPKQSASFLIYALYQLPTAHLEPPRCAQCKSYRALEWRPKDPTSENSEVVCDKCEGSRLWNDICARKQQKEQAVAAYGTARQQLLTEFLAEVWGHALHHGYLFVCRTRDHFAQENESFMVP